MGEVHPTVHGAAWLTRLNVRFNRNELAGAFGDLGTDLPLVIGMVLAAGLDSASVLIMFGVMQLLTGFAYGMPMPVQPLKAVAVIVITTRVSASVLYGGALAIGLLMLVLTATRLLNALARVIPHAVVRGIQFGLGLQLAFLALRDYVPAAGTTGFVLAGVAFAIGIALLGNRKYPAALVIVLLGVVYAVLLGFDTGAVIAGVSVRLPEFLVPTPDAILAGFLLLALPQIPLSLGNSILATRQITLDYFPERAPSVRKIGLTYSAMNLINPFFGGVPTCHGSGGMAGHYTFGARTGGSVVIEGSMYVVLGLFFSTSFATVIQVFPLPMLGVILLFEGLALILLTRDLTASKADFQVAILVGLIASGLPYGFLLGLVVGAILAYLTRRGAQST